MQIIFVAGSSRSGTTLMSRILNQHSTIFSFNELHFFEQLCETERLNEVMNQDSALALADKLSGIQNEGFLLFNEKNKYLKIAKEILETLKPENFTSLNIYKAFINKFVTDQGKINGCDQTPRNVLYLKEIIENIPEAKVICMVRDPRSVLLSQKSKWKRKFLGAKNIPFKETIRSYFNYHPYTISKLWKASSSHTVQWKGHEKVLTIKFEDLVENPLLKVKEICIFLGIPYEEKMLQVSHIGSSHKTDDKEAAMGVSSSAKETWKKGGLTKAELFICQKVNTEMMDQLGYLKENIKSIPYFSLAFQGIIFPVKMSIALMLNLNRVKNLKQAILRRL